jgi:Na+/phosphate symporter
MLIALSLLVSLIGLLMYALAANPKVNEIGRIMFWVGLLAFLLRVGPETIGLMGK